MTYLHSMTHQPEHAGSASGLLGVLQFLPGAIVAPLVGIAGEDTAVPMAVVIAGMGVGAVAVTALARTDWAAGRAAPAGVGP